MCVQNCKLKKEQEILKNSIIFIVLAITCYNKQEEAKKSEKGTKQDWFKNL